MIQIILSSILIMLASLIGVISVWKKFGEFIEKNLHYLVSFSSGVFLIIAYELIHESTLIWIASGAILSFIIFKLLPDFHHHEDSHEGHHHSKIDARRILLSDATHNLGDGILLASSFSISYALGIATTISVFIHEIIQEISEFFVLKQAGYTTKKALLMNFFASSTILIGSIGGYFLLEKFEAIEAPLLGLTAGAFLVVIAHDLIPHSIKSIITRAHAFRHFSWFALGLILMLIFGLVLGH